MYAVPDAIPYPTFGFNEVETARRGTYYGVMPLNARAGDIWVETVAESREQKALRIGRAELALGTKSGWEAEFDRISP